MRKKAKQSAVNARYDADCEEARREGGRKPKKPQAIPREATPTKYKKVQKGKGPSLEEVEDNRDEEDEEEEQSERSTGSDDDSYEEK
jgi:hypothetical protein